MLWAALVSALSVYPSVLLLGADGPSCVRLFARGLPRSRPERFLLCAVGALALGSWLGALPMPLDADRPWQRWPVPVTWGGLLGWTGGAVLGLLVGGPKCD